MLCCVMLLTLKNSVYFTQFTNKKFTKTYISIDNSWQFCCCVSLWLNDHGYKEKIQITIWSFKHSKTEIITFSFSTEKRNSRLQPKNVSQLPSKVTMVRTIYTSYFIYMKYIATKHYGLYWPYHLTISLSKW